MIELGWIPVLALQLVFGFVLAGCFVRVPSSPAACRVLRFSLALGLGTGFSSILFYLLLVIGLQPRASAWVTHGLLLAATIALYVSRRGRLGKIAAEVAPLYLVAPVEGIEQVRLRLVNFFLIALLVLGIAVNTGVFVSDTLQRPHGDWDAFATWNLKSRFLFRGGEHWKNMFSERIVFGHADYPLLVPATNAQAWLISGRESTLAPAVLAFLFAADTTILMAAVMWLVKSRFGSYITAISLLSCPSFIQIAALQFADLPLCYFVACSSGMLILARRLEKSSLWYLCGLFAGFAMWTKNEGAAFMLSLLGAVVLVLVRPDWKSMVTVVRRIVIGALPGLLAYVIFKTLTHQPNEVFAGQTLSSVLGRLTPERLSLVVQASFICLSLPSDWLFNYPAVLLYMLIFKFDRNYQSVVWLLVVATVLFGTAFTLIYLVTPFNLVWQVGTTVSRLKMHLLPMIVFALFLLVKIPGPMIERSEIKSFG